MKMHLILLLLSFATLSIAQTTPQPDASKLYKTKCQRCHGKSGDKGLFGASKLSQSKMEEDAIVLLIQTGSRSMPSFKKSLTEDEINAIVSYIKSLRK